MGAFQSGNVAFPDSDFIPLGEYSDLWLIDIDQLFDVPFEFQQKYSKVTFALVCFFTSDLHETDICSRGMPIGAATASGTYFCKRMAANAVGTGCAIATWTVAKRPRPFSNDVWRVHKDITLPAFVLEISPSKLLITLNLHPDRTTLDDVLPRANEMGECVHVEEVTSRKGLVTRLPNTQEDSSGASLTRILVVAPLS